MIGPTISQEAYEVGAEFREQFVTKESDSAAFFITDEGSGFDPLDVPDPTAVENLERPCGRGLMLMKHYMSEVDFNERGNSVRMAKVMRNGKT